MGGMGTIDFDVTGCKLIVRTTEKGHKEIEQLLEAIRPETKKLSQNR
jgi:hypothetical protein